MLHGHVIRWFVLARVRNGDPVAARNRVAASRETNWACAA
jgi:hypothetical protein